MNLREWMNNNPQVVALGAVVLLVVVLGVVYLQVFRQPAPRSEAYFWDVQANDAFVAAIGADPPIEAPSGGEGVRAHLFSCAACEPEEWFGYLETYSEAYQRLIAERGNPPEGDIEGGPGGMPPGEWEEFRQANHLMRALDGDAAEWVPFESPAGEAIRRGVRERCAGEPARCQP